MAPELPPAASPARSGRRFARLRRDPPPGRGGLFDLPDDGLCLSAFLVVQPSGRPHEVLAGRPAADPAWTEIGSLEGERLRSMADRWMLPASQLLFFESPEEAARRIAAEQLRRPDLSLPAPRIFSEAYSRPGGPAHDPHWDLHFVFRAEWPGGELAASRGSLWRELAFVDVTRTSATAFGRGHGDVLALAGLPPMRGEPD